MPCFWVCGRLQAEPHDPAREWREHGSMREDSSWMPQRGKKKKAKAAKKDMVSFPSITSRVSSYIMTTMDRFTSSGSSRRTSHGTMGSGGSLPTIDLQSSGDGSSLPSMTSRCSSVRSSLHGSEHSMMVVGVRRHQEQHVPLSTVVEMHSPRGNGDGDELRAAVTTQLTQTPVETSTIVTAQPTEAPLDVAAVSAEVSDSAAAVEESMLAVGDQCAVVADAEEAVVGRADNSDMSPAMVQSLADPAPAPASAPVVTECDFTEAEPSTALGVPEDSNASLSLPSEAASTVPPPTAPVAIGIAHVVTQTFDSNAGAETVQVNTTGASRTAAAVVTKPVRDRSEKRERRSWGREHVPSAPPRRNSPAATPARLTSQTTVLPPCGSPSVSSTSVLVSQAGVLASPLPAGSTPPTSPAPAKTQCPLTGSHNPTASVAKQSTGKTTEVNEVKKVERMPPAGSKAGKAWAARGKAGIWGADGGKAAAPVLSAAQLARTQRAAHTAAPATPAGMSQSLPAASGKRLVGSRRQLAAHSLTPASPSISPAVSLLATADTPSTGSPDPTDSVAQQSTDHTEGVMCAEDASTRQGSHQAASALHPPAAPVAAAGQPAAGTSPAPASEVVAAAAVPAQAAVTSQVEAAAAAVQPANSIPPQSASPSLGLSALLAQSPSLTSPRDHTPPHQPALISRCEQVTQQCAEQAAEAVQCAMRPGRCATAHPRQADLPAQARASTAQLRQQLLQQQPDWVQETVNGSTDNDAVRLFLQSADVQPEVVALLFGSDSLTTSQWRLPRSGPVTTLQMAEAVARQAPALGALIAIIPGDSSTATAAESAADSTCNASPRLPTHSASDSSRRVGQQEEVLFECENGQQRRQHPAGLQQAGDEPLPVSSQQAQLQSASQAAQAATQQQRASWLSAWAADFNSMLGTWGWHAKQQPAQTEDVGLLLGCRQQGGGPTEGVGVRVEACQREQAAQPTQPRMSAALAQPSAALSQFEQQQEARKATLNLELAPDMWTLLPQLGRQGFIEWGVPKHVVELLFDIPQAVWDHPLYTYLKNRVTISHCTRVFQERLLAASKVKYSRLTLTVMGRVVPLLSEDGVPQHWTHARLEEQGLKYEDAKPDGTCFWRAMSFQIFGTQDLWKDLRKLITECREMYRPLGLLNAGLSLSSMANMGLKGAWEMTWGGDNDVPFIANIFRMNVHLYILNYDRVHVFSPDDVQAYPHNGLPDIAVYYDGAKHYGSVVAKGE